MDIGQLIITMKHLLHIAAHLGGGAGKAISGLIKNVGEYENTVVLLEAPQDRKYCEACIDFGAEVIIAPERKVILELAEKADAVIFNWWAHPLSVDLIRDLSDVDCRLVVWSHVNGLQYPVLTAGFLDTFDADLLTSPCSLKNDRFSPAERELINSKSSIVFGTGNFEPGEYKRKTDYSITGNVRIGYVGTLDFAKMNPSFPEICFGIRRKISNAQFILCGKYTAEFRDLFFKEYPVLEECTVFTGYVDDVEERLLSFDVFCYPLTKENYATTENALLEAMAVGLPVVVLDNPAESSIIDNENTGIVAADIKSFVRSAAYLCMNEENRKKLGTAARNNTIEKYDPRTNADRFIKVINTVLQKEKKKHNFRSIIGSDIWENFLYFCGDDRRKIIDIMNGKEAELPGIFRSISKSSPAHYYSFFRDVRFESLVKQIGVYRNESC